MVFLVATNKLVVSFFVSVLQNPWLISVFHHPRLISTKVRALLLSSTTLKCVDVCSVVQLFMWGVPRSGPIRVKVVVAMFITLLDLFIWAMFQNISLKHRY
jgi:hypothetical protein